MKSEKMRNEVRKSNLKRFFPATGMCFLHDYCLMNFAVPKEKDLGLPGPIPNYKHLNYTSE